MVTGKCSGMLPRLRSLLQTVNQCTVFFIEKLLLWFKKKRSPSLTVYIIVDSLKANIREYSLHWVKTMEADQGQMCQKWKMQWTQCLFKSSVPMF